MRRERRLSLWIAAVAMATGLIGYGGREVAEGADAKPGAWMGGAGFGFLADTPNGTAFALNLNAETFVAPKFSVGPLLQLGFTPAGRSGLCPQLLSGGRHLVVDSARGGSGLRPDE